MFSLKEKVAIVTGASSGIGRAAARLFAEHGAAVVVGARRETELAALVREIRDDGGRAEFVAGDVCDEGFSEALVKKATDTYGRLDIGFNNAGILGNLGPAADMSAADWRQTLDVNLTGAFLCAKHQLPVMEEAGAGSLLFTSSVAGHTVGMPGMAAYGAAKLGLLGLTRVLAAEYGPKGIRVNALIPGATDTEMAVQSTGGSAEVLDFVRGLHALKRSASPEEIANAALFLVSDSASFLTGGGYLTDGGISINRT